MRIEHTMTANKTHVLFDVKETLDYQMSFLCNCGKIATHRIMMEWLAVDERFEMKIFTCGDEKHTSEALAYGFEKSEMPDVKPSIVFSDDPKVLGFRKLE